MSTTGFCAAAAVPKSAGDFVERNCRVAAWPSQRKLPLTRKMHEHELSIDQALVEQLVAAQFPQWAGLPVRHASSAGTDNAMFRLGDTMVVRLPRID
jgi:hypothetical protein